MNGEMWVSHPRLLRPALGTNTDGWRVLAAEAAALDPVRNFPHTMVLTQSHGYMLIELVAEFVLRLDK